MPGRRAAIALAVILSCQLLIGLDATVVNIALPDIQRSLGFSGAGLAWVLNAYTLTFGGLLLLGGRVGDLAGRRRAFVAGTLIFTVASLLGGLAPGPGWLIAARAAQGVGGALLGPNALALITTTFAGPARTRAIGLFSVVTGASVAVGLLVGGVVTAALSWRWSLFINVPVCAAIVPLALRYLPDTERHRGRLDVTGALTVTAGMSLLVYGFIRAAGAPGWSDRWTLASLLGGALLVVSFVAAQARGAAPTIPLRVFLDRNRAAGFAGMLLLVAAMFGSFFFLTQFLQEILGYGPLRAGVAFLPLVLPQTVSARLAPRLLPRFGPRPVSLTGAALMAGGMFWLSRMDAGTGYLDGILGPMLLIGTGLGLALVPLSVVILTSVDRADAGAASGLLQTMQYTGGSLGLAVLVTVAGRGDFVPGAAAAFTAAVVFACGAIAVGVLVLRTRAAAFAGPAPAPEPVPAPVGARR